MNKKNKVLITSIGLALFSGIAATSSTFAWFSAVQNASVSFNSATVKYEENDLSVAYKSSLNTGITAGGTGSLILDGANMVTDISGNGLNFYKPLWDSATDTPSARAAYAISQLATASSGDADGYFVDFTLTISRTETGNKRMKVYLGAGSGIVAATPEDDEDEQAVLGARLAVIAVVESTPTVLLTYAPADSTHSFIVADAEAATPLYGVEHFATDSVGAVSSFTNYATNDLAAAANAVVIADLSTAASADVTFRAWLEGEDEHTINDAIGGIFKINLNLYGLSVSA